MKPWTNPYRKDPNSGSPEEQTKDNEFESILSRKKQRYHE